MDRHDKLHLLGVALRARCPNRAAREAGDERSRTLKRTDACDASEMAERRGVIEAAKRGDSESRRRFRDRQFKSACSGNVEGAEPGSTNVDGSYQALRASKVRYIMRTLLTREERVFYPNESRWVNSEAQTAQRLRAPCCDAAPVNRLIAGIARQSPATCLATIAARSRWCSGRSPTARCRRSAAAPLPRSRCRRAGESR